MCDVLTAQHPRSRPAFPSACRQAQRGVLLISALVMVIVFGAMLTMWAQRESAATRVERARTIGDALAVLGNGLDDYIKTNHRAIVANTSIQSSNTPAVTISTPRVITAQKLVSFMALRGVGDRPPHMRKGEYKIEIAVSQPVSANVSADTQRVTALLYIDAPVQHRGRLDLLMAKTAAKQMGRHGGMTDAANPDVVTFNDSTNQVLAPVDNPVGKDPSGNSIAGILVRRAGDVLSSSNEDYLPRNGSLPMTGSLDMGGRSIHNVHEFESSGRMWLKGGANTYDKLGLWVGDWKGNNPVGTPRGIKASGSITSLGTLYGEQAIIGRGEYGTEIQEEGINTSSIWARSFGGNRPSGMATGTGRHGDVYASHDVKAGRSIHADGNIRVGKGLLVGYANGTDWGNPGELWTSAGATINGLLSARGGGMVQMPIYENRLGAQYSLDLSVHKNRDDDNELNKGDTSHMPLASANVELVAKLYRIELAAATGLGGANEAQQNAWVDVPLGKWLICSGSVNEYLEQRPNHPVLARLGMTSNHDWSLKYRPLWSVTDPARFFFISCFGKLRKSIAS